MDPHFAIGVAPGDGQIMAFQELMGVKRASYALYTNQQITAQQALEFGLVNEIVERDALLSRAQELAALIMKQPRGCRRMTSQILKRQWKRRLAADSQVHLGHEFLGMFLDRK